MYLKIEGKNQFKRLVYKGFDKHFNLTNLEPYTNYSLELLVKRQSKNESNIFIKDIMVQTAVESNTFKLFYTKGRI